MINLVGVDKKIKRGIKELLPIYVLLHNLHEAEVERMTTIFYSGSNVDLLFVKNMFKLSEELVDTAADFEEELLRDSRLIETVYCLCNASDFKRIEGNLNRLKHLVLYTVRSSLITRNSKELRDVDKDVEEMKQGSKKRNASAKKDITTEVKKSGKMRWRIFSVTRKN